jgi:hypothetical protein
LVYRTTTGAGLAGQFRIWASDESETEAVTADTNPTETKLHAVTANRLRDGTIIYFTGKQTWSAAFAEAATAENGEALLAEAAAGPLAREAVGAYVIEVTQSEGGIRPIGLREEIRAFGPTA